MKRLLKAMGLVFGIALFLTMSFASAVFAEDIEIIYSGKDTIDMRFYNLDFANGATYKIYFKYDNDTEILLKTWTPESYYTTQELYFAHTQGLLSCEENSKCKILLKRINKDSTYEYVAATAYDIVTTFEKGRLHNNNEWQFKLGRGEVKWQQSGSKYIVGTLDKDVVLASGTLKIDNVAVELVGNLKVIGDITIDTLPAIIAKNTTFITYMAKSIQFISYDNVIYSSQSKFEETTFEDVTIDIGAGDATQFIEFIESEFKRATIYLGAKASKTLFERCKFNLNVTVPEMYTSQIESNGAKSTIFSKNHFGKVMVNLKNALDTVLISNKFLDANAFFELGSGVVFKSHIVDLPINLIGYGGVTYTDNKFINLGNISIYNGNNQIINNSFDNTSLWSDKYSYTDLNDNNTISDNLFVNNSQIRLVNSNKTSIVNNKVRCNQLNPVRIGIYLLYSKELSVENNKIEYCKQGIQLQYTSNSTLKNNALIDNRLNGILLDRDAHNNVIASNLVNRAGFNNNLNGEASLRSAIRLGYNSDNNTFYNNMLMQANGSGITIGYREEAPHGGCDNNTFYTNIIDKSADTGIYFATMNNYDNLIYNNVIKNSEFQNSYDVINNKTRWNLNNLINAQNIIGGPFKGGNYWSDYICIDDNKNGIGDTPRVINTKNNINVNVKDEYPLCLQPEKPNADISPTTLAFQTTVGSISEPLHITVSNIGKVPLTILNINFVGENEENFGLKGNNCLKDEIAPNDLCTVGVVFYPDKIGQFNVDMDIITNEGIGRRVKISGEGIAKPERCDFNLNLIRGWNFVSFPCEPENKAIKSVLDTLLSKIRIVWTYGNGIWTRFKPSDESTSTLNNISGGKGYWIYAQDSGNKTISGFLKSNVSLITGWNLVGFSIDSTSADNALSGLFNKWEHIWGWDSTNGWKLKINEASTPQGIPQLQNLEKGNAYWIQMKEGATWNQN